MTTERKDNTDPEMKETNTLSYTEDENTDMTASPNDTLDQKCLDDLIWLTSIPPVEDCSSDLVPHDTKPGPFTEAELERFGPREGTQAASDAVNREQSASTRTVLEETLPRRKYLLVPDLLSMTRFLCRNYKRMIYSYLNRCLRDGSLAQTAGIPIRDRRLDRNNCELKKFSFWKTDRSSFYTDVTVHLTLSTPAGTRTWEGTLAIWCSFPEKEELEEDAAFVKSLGVNGGAAPGQDAADPSACDDFVYNVEGLYSESPYRGDCVRLSPFLIPYYKNGDVEKVAEATWLEHIPEALTDPKKRDAFELAAKMGLEVRFYPLYKRKETHSILFFDEEILDILEDDLPSRTAPRPVRIPGNTIVINTKTSSASYPDYNIFHECLHYREHYLFYRLQGLRSSDTKQIKREKVPADSLESSKPVDLDPCAVSAVPPEPAADPGDESSSKTIAADKKRKTLADWKRPLHDPLYFMEKQANRAAYALMMPAPHMHSLIHSVIFDAVAELKAKGTKHRHTAALYEDVGIRLANKLKLPYFRIRARFLQLGYLEAAGALNFAEKRMVEAFMCSEDAWRDFSHTYFLDRKTMFSIMSHNEDFAIIMQSGEYIYADGHIVKNSDKYVRQVVDIREGLRNILTDWANSHVDECCLRFVRRYVQKDIGKYEYGRLNYDAEYIARTKYYVEDFLRRENLGEVDDIEARQIYTQHFPRKFDDAFRFLKVASGFTMVEIADMLQMDNNTLRRWISDPSKYRNENFLTALALIFKLPDWITRLLFKRASISLDEDEPRHLALEYIIRAQSCDGIPAANQYLKDHGFEPLWGEVENL